MINLDTHYYGTGYKGTNAVAYETGTGVQAVAVGDTMADAVQAMLMCASNDETNIIDYVWMDAAQYVSYVSLVKAYKGDTVSCSTCHMPVTLDVADWIEASGRCNECGETTTFYDF
jgi:hypothetical protein